MKVCIVNALPALTAGIGHLRIVFILLMIAVICILRIHLGRLGFWRMAEFIFRCAWLFRLFFRRPVFFLLLLGLHIFRRLLFFRFPHAMGQDEFRSLFQILGKHVLSSRQSGFSPGSFDEVNISLCPATWAFNVYTAASCTMASETSTLPSAFLASSTFFFRLPFLPAIGP